MTANGGPLHENACCGDPPANYTAAGASVARHVRSGRASIRGGAVRPHVQAFADAVSKATGATSFGTYPGHQPTIDRATDIFTPIDSYVLGRAICQFAFENWDRFGLRYVIYRQNEPGFGINWNDGLGWERMRDTGDPVQNHKEHVHVAFEASAPPVPVPKPPEEDAMTIYLYQFGPDIYATDFVRASHVAGNHDRANLEETIKAANGKIQWLKQDPTKDQHVIWTRT